MSNEYIKYNAEWHSNYYEDNREHLLFLMKDWKTKNKTNLKCMSLINNCNLNKCLEPKYDYDGDDNCIKPPYKYIQYDLSHYYKIKDLSVNIGGGYYKKYLKYKLKYINLKKLIK